MNFQITPRILQWPRFRMDGYLRVLTILMAKADSSGSSAINPQHITAITGITHVTLSIIIDRLCDDGVLEQNDDGSIQLKRMPEGIEFADGKPARKATVPAVETTGTVATEGKQKRFVKPTEEEVEAYIKEKGYHFTAEEYMAHYESNGWMVGKNHMKDWKAACRTFEVHWKKSQRVRSAMPLASSKNESTSQRANNYGRQSNYQQQRDDARRLLFGAAVEGLVPTTTDNR